MDSISKQRGGDDEGRRVYKEFEPAWECVPEQDSDTLLLHLPGFKKEQLRVQLTRTRNLIISGERPIEDNTWSRFRTQFDVPKNCDTNAIGARFDAGVLHIRQPKLIITAEKQEDEKPTITEPPKPHKPMEEPQPQATGTRATSTANPPEPTNKKKDNEFEAAKSVSNKALEEREKKTGKESESADSKKSEGREERDAKGVGEKNLKEENASDKYARDGTGMSRGGTGDGDGSGKSRAETYRRAAGGEATEVKTLRKVMNMALAVLMILVLGMYIVKTIRSPVKVED